MASSFVAESIIHLSSVIASCIPLVYRASEVIKEVARHGELQAVDKSANQLSASAAKDFEDPQTIADRRSQTIIVESLKKLFPGIIIVGEEEGYLDSLDDIEPLPGKSHEYTNSVHFPDDLCNIDISRVCIWDGDMARDLIFLYRFCHHFFGLMRDSLLLAPEFAICLIGVPMPSGQVSDATELYWGCKDVGVFLGSKQLNPPKKNEETFRLAITGSRRNSELDSIISILGPDSLLEIGGSGKKILLVINGDVDCCLNNTSGTKRWDTCAGEALLRALSGKLTDINGKVYTYKKDTHDLLSNNDGMLAAIDDLVIDRVVAASTKCYTTKDITQDANGVPINVDWLRANLMIPHSECILSFVAPEETAVRSRHSHVVKIYLRYSSASRKSFNNELVHVVLLKRCVAKDLSSRAIEKLARDVNSYANESMFVSELSLKVREHGGIYVPQPYYSFTEKHDSPIQCKFLSIVESLEDFEQCLYLDFAHATRALREIAKFHAFFMSKMEVTDHARKILWKHGGHWDIDKIPTGSAELETIAQTFEAWFSRFSSCGGAFDELSMQTLGKRYQEKATLISQLLHQTIEQRGTIIHGDFKTANLFFKKGVDISESQNFHMAGKMAMIDWQWTGMGIGVQDVVYLFVTSLDYTTLTHEKELLFYYHEQLTENLSAYGANITYDFDTLIVDYRIAAIDYIRKLISYNLKDASPVEVERIKDEINRGMYIRRMDTLEWLLKKASLLIDTFDS
eukprot:gene4195-6541_t